MSSVISYIYRLNNVRIFLNPKPNKKNHPFSGGFIFESFVLIPQI